MTTNYDEIGDRYVRSKLRPWRTHVECHSFQRWIGDPRERDVLDLACGDGFHTRRVKAMGAARTVGVDLSQSMIDRARAREFQEPLGIEYLAADARALPDLGKFDLVIAAYLLNYARDPAELAAMLGSVASVLQPGGRFVSINSNPFFDFSTAPDFRPYGFFVRSKPGREEGSPIIWTQILDEGTFDIENYYLSPATHERVLNESGFTSFDWHRPEVSPEGIAEFGEPFWRPLIDHPPVIVLECRLDPRQVRG